MVSCFCAVAMEHAQQAITSVSIVLFISCVCLYRTKGNDNQNVVCGMAG